jgi:YegS/Rv2252/BmrU family lipid kinase
MSGRRFSVIVNPHGGNARGLTAWQQAGREFRSAGARVDVQFTTRAGHAAELAATLAFDDSDALVVVGGDGTLHEVVNGLMRRADKPPPLGLIAGGTGNSVRQHLGLCSPIEAARQILEGQPMPLDLARVETAGRKVYCTNLVGWGGVVDVNRGAEKLRWLGPPRYAIATAWQMAAPRFRRARLTVDGQECEADYLFVVGCCTAYVGSGMRMAPRADLSDGLIDVVAVRRVTRRQMAKLFSRVFSGTHIGLPFVEYRQVRSFAVSEAGGPLNLDGELAGSAPFSAAAVPAALRLLR